MTTLTKRSGQPFPRTLTLVAGASSEATPLPVAWAWAALEEIQVLASARGVMVVPSSCQSQGVYAQAVALGKGLRALVDGEWKGRRLVLKSRSRELVLLLLGQHTDATCPLVASLALRCRELLDQLGCKWEAVWTSPEGTAHVQRLCSMARKESAKEAKECA